MNALNTPAEKFLFILLMVLLAGYFFMALIFGITNHKLTVKQASKYQIPETGEIWYNMEDKTVHIMSDSCHTIYYFKTCDPRR